MCGEGGRGEVRARVIGGECTHTDTHRETHTDTHLGAHIRKRRHTCICAHLKNGNSMACGVAWALRGGVGGEDVCSVRAVAPADDSS